MTSQSSTTNTTVIIGAGGGIGTALTKRLAEQGDTLALVGRDIGKLEPLSAVVGGHPWSVDARQFEDLSQCFASIAEDLGPIRRVVNLAGSILLKPAHLTSDEEYRDVLDTNLTTAFATVRAAASVMRKGGGSIVLMSSAAAEVGLPSHEAIAAAKAGVIGLARSAAATYANVGIRVNVIAPGLVDSPLSEKITSNPTSLKASVAMHPLGRIGTPEDIVPAIAWLLSDESAWVTGQVIGVDGGLGHVKGRTKA